MITAKINVTRILKEHLYQGKNGKYLDLVIFENKNGPDQHGNTHMVVQGVSKEARERGVKGPIIGNLKLENQPRPKPPQARPAPARLADTEDSSVPF